MQKDIKIFINFVNLKKYIMNSNSIQIPLSEYQNLKKTIELLSDNNLLSKVNKLIDLLFEEKYGLYMADYTDDLTEYSINNSWEDEESGWDKIKDKEKLY